MFFIFLLDICVTALSMQVQNPRANLRGKRQEEERKFKRRAKYFLVTQLVAVMVFISLLGGSEIELDDNDDDLNYD